MSRTGTSATIIEWLCPTSGWMARISNAIDGDAGAVMAKLIYASNMKRGAFDWAPPDDDVFGAPIQQGRRLPPLPRSVAARRDRATRTAPERRVRDTRCERRKR